MLECFNTAFVNKVQKDRWQYAEIIAERQRDSVL